MKVHSLKLPRSTDRSRDAVVSGILARDAALDGHFYYGVQSTGIYCLPSCPSRRPHPRQLRVFTTADDAENAGFRACLRCKPRQAPRSERSRAIQLVCRLLRANLEKTPNLRDLAQASGVSAYHLQRTFRQAMGITPRQFAEAVRNTRLKSHLRRGDNVTTALHKSGFASSSRLYERSNGQMGMTPATYQRGGQGMSISYTIAPCALGRVLVAYTDRGVSAVFLGDNDDRLTSMLNKEYPRGAILRAHGEPSRWVAKIVRHLDGFDPHLDLPTDVIATAFQRRVWQALRAIPFGTTRTYSEVARAIGQPSAIRAVARACATNPASIVVPCHRVIRTDGSLGGFRWGLERKQQLLAQEKAGGGSNQGRSRIKPG